MPTPHNSAAKGEIAKTVLMPGDPLRAKFIAQTFLKDAKLVNSVRGMLAYTGEYNGSVVSVMGSGMGMPSIGIYSYELYTQYDVENIIRIGSCGSYSPQLGVGDLVLVSSSYSESSFARVQNGYDKDTTYPSEQLNSKILNVAKELGVTCTVGKIHSSDVFYRESDDVAKWVMKDADSDGGELASSDSGSSSSPSPTPGLKYWEKLRDEKGCLVVEMESFALFHNAKVLGKKAACLLTVSDSFVSKKQLTSEEREKTFTEMMEVALVTSTQ